MLQRGVKSSRDAPVKEGFVSGFPSEHKKMWQYSKDLLPQDLLSQLQKLLVGK